MQEYRTAKGWAILIYISAPLLIILFGYLLFLPFIGDGDNSLTVAIILVPVSIAMIVFMIIGLIDTMKGRTVIDEDKISVLTSLSKRELRFEEIKGFRVDDNYIHIESATPGKKNLKISIYVGRSDEIIQWLSEYYPDLDILSIEEEQQEILNNEKHGHTTEEREAKLRVTRRKTKILNFTGVIVAAWTTFWPEPYDLAVLSSMAIPIIALITLKFADGLIKFDENYATAYPSLGISFLFPTLAIILRAILDYNIYDYSKVWVLTAPVTIVFLATLFFRNREFQFKQAKDYFIVLVLTLLIFGYGFGSVIMLNCYYDNSESEVYSAKIINKRISSGSTTTYYLKLSEWRNQTEPDEVTVSEELYNQLEKDDEVSVYYQKGQFEIPWFFVTD